MSSRIWLFLLVVTMLVVSSNCCFSRLIEKWPYERLLKEADFVIIGTPESSEDSLEKLLNKNWNVIFQGINTKFTIRSALKGKIEEATLTVVHFKAPEGVKLSNGPLFVSFRTHPLEVTTKRSKVILGKPDYILFLKKRNDGRYEAISGQIDPELSVRELISPFEGRK